VKLYSVEHKFLLITIYNLC